MFADVKPSLLAYGLHVSETVDNGVQLIKVIAF